MEARQGRDAERLDAKHDSPTRAAGRAQGAMTFDSNSSVVRTPDASILFLHVKL
jgi:hypothetical protein